MDRLFVRGWSFMGAGMDMGRVISSMVVEKVAWEIVAHGCERI